MFSMQEKQHIAAKIEELLLSLEHPEMPTEHPEFALVVQGKEAWSFARIMPNWVFSLEHPPSVNPWNEVTRERLKEC